MKGSPEILNLLSSFNYTFLLFRFVPFIYATCIEDCTYNIHILGVELRDV